MITNIIWLLNPYKYITVKYICFKTLISLKPVIAIEINKIKLVKKLKSLIIQ